MKQTIFSWWFAKRLVYLIVATVLFAYILSSVLVRATASNNDQPVWARPSAMTVRRVSFLNSAQSEPTFLNNLDCTLVTYRLVAGSTMQTGCFTETAFGLLDSDSDVVIFNGTDEGLPLLTHTSHQVLAPWPKAMDLVALDPIDTGGTLISLYKNPLGATKDQRNLLAQLTAKQLTGPPDITLKDPSGKPLVINPQTMAFSDGGSWLVAETLGGSFLRVNLATLAMTAFAPAYGSQGSPALLKSRVAVSEDGRFVAIANDDAPAFKVYDLTTCDGIVNNLQPQNCQSYDYRPFAGQQVAGLQSIRHLRFLNDGLLSFEAVSANPANSGIYELAPAASIKSLTDYIGLGDSYTSGEGAFDYLADTDSDDNMCHLSRNSYPLLLTHDLFSSSGGHSVACSGAVINDVGSTSDSYRGQVRGVGNFQQLEQSQALLLESVETNFVPGYVAQQRFIKRWQPRFATVSIGGNDIGFDDMLQNCVEPHVSRHTSGNTCYNTYEDRLEVMRLIGRTVPRWTSLFVQLRREAPNMQLYAIGYPQVAVDTGNCALNVQLNKSELEFGISLVDYLNQDMQKAAVAASIPYVDISQALAGHRLCEAASYNVAVNGLTAGTDAGVPGIKVLGKESYHPNAFGQSLIEQTILKQTHNLAEVAFGNNVITDSGSALLAALKTGRPVNTLVPDSSLTSGIVKRGGNVLVRASGASDGLQPNSTYTIRLDGPSGGVISVLASGASGDINGSFTIPASTVPGGHTIDITGVNQGGEPVDVTQPIYVPSSDADSDGDGIEDITDSCPAAINSGQDNDGDGVDDICDGLIGPPPGGSASSGSHGSPGSLSQNGNAMAHVLGSTTASPNVVSKTPPKQAAQKDRVNPTYNRPLPRKIYWLYWLVLAAILWLVLLLAEKYTKKKVFRLQ
jgi:hypothetical protein